MKTRLLLILFLPLLIFLGAFFLFAFASTSTYQSWSVENESAPEGVTRDAMRRVDLARPDWRTLVVSVSREVDLPRGTIWSTWADLNGWPRWSQPLHRSTRWIGEPGWRAGARFEQVLELGFPAGEQVSHERVDSVVLGEQIIWTKLENGVRSCHIWKFDELAPGRTRITNVEVFHGTSIGMIKILVGAKWLKLFELAVKNLSMTAGKVASG